MKAVFLVIFALVSSGCSTASFYGKYTSEWYDLKDQYEKECRSHYSKYIQKLKSIREKDPLLTYEDSVDYLCNLDRESCTPPKKPDRFEFLEKIGRPVVSDYCRDFLS